jgi:hypothetical protein
MCYFAREHITGVQTANKVQDRSITAYSCIHVGICNSEVAGVFVRVEDRRSVRVRSKKSETFRLSYLVSCVSYSEQQKPLVHSITFLILQNPNVTYKPTAPYLLAASETDGRTGVCILGIYGD